MQTKFGSLIVDGSGKIGGHVASKNKAGNFLRTKVKPTKSNSIGSVNQRNIFKKINYLWKSLTYDEVHSFNTASSDYFFTNAFGDKKKLTGYQLFVSINQNLFYLNKPPIRQYQMPKKAIDAFITATTKISMNINDQLDFAMFSPDMAMITIYELQYKRNRIDVFTKPHLFGKYYYVNYIQHFFIKPYDEIITNNNDGPAEKTQFDVILRSAGKAEIKMTCRYVDLTTGESVDVNIHDITLNL